MGWRQIEFVQVIAFLVFADSKYRTACGVITAGHTHAEQFVFCLELVQGGDNNATAGDGFLTAVVRFPPKCRCQCCWHWPRSAPRVAAPVLSLVCIEIILIRDMIGPGRAVLSIRSDFAQFTLPEVRAGFPVLCIDGGSAGLAAQNAQCLFNVLAS